MLRFFLLLGISAFVLPAIAAPCAPIDLRATKRVVCLGDSITDGQTYALLVQQGLRACKKPVPICIAAGIGGDTAGGMLGRLERDVLRYHPQLVILSTGINDCATGVTVKEFRVTLSAIAERLQKEHVRLMILSLTTIRGYTYQEHAPRLKDTDHLTLDEANAILREVADQYACPLAEVSRGMAAAPHELNLWAPDGCHLNFDGFRYMAQPILTALGCPDAPLPATYANFIVPELPGVIHQWRIHPMQDNEPPIDEKTLAALRIDATWQPYQVPEQTSIADTDWWQDQERQHGFAVNLKKNLGPAAKGYACYAEVTVKRTQQRFLNTGGEAGNVYLNGVRVTTENYAAGWHAGGHRIPVTLKKGKNILLLTTGRRFFLSLTKTDVF